MRTLAALSLASSVSLFVAHSELPRSRADRFAAPGVIVFSGKSLASQIVLADWTENQRLMAALTSPAPASETVLAGRARIEIAIYWGAEWSRFASTSDSLAVLARIHQPQSGVYYPASRSKPALWVFGPMGGMASSTRVVSDEAAAILRKHGLPARVK